MTSKSTSATELSEDDVSANDLVPRIESDDEDLLVLDTSFISFVSSSKGIDEDEEDDTSLGEPTGSTAGDDKSLASASLDTGSEDNGSPLQDELDDEQNEIQSGAELGQALHSNAPTYSRNQLRNYQNHRERYNRPHSTRVMTKRRQQSTPVPVETEYNADANTYSTTSISEPVVVLGMDITNLNPTAQFLACASGVFLFNLSFGFLQEFVSVEICSRNLGLFLAMAQFSGYTFLSYILRTYVNQNKETESTSITKTQAQIHSYPAVPTYMYLGIGALSAIDMAMTNMAMHYINFPAKTLMKSTRVVFTMIFGVLIAGKRYRLVDYALVLCMVAGLAIFMQADASSNAIFEPMGVFMLTISLTCDGATNILSETIMKTYGVGQDELIFRMYSLALIAVTATAVVNGDFHAGIAWMTKPGTYDEWISGVSEDEVTWNVPGKVIMIILFSSTGFFGSSCSAAIIKNFGALTMSMTSTARRAMTLFISFFMFDNECTYQHVSGMTVFIAAMTTKSLMGRSKGPKAKLPLSPPPRMKDPELGNAIPPSNTSKAVSVTQ